MAPAASTGDAVVVSRRCFSRGTSALRVCPICESRAVSDKYEEVDGLDGRYFLRCGECETWRSIYVGFWTARALERRLRRDRRRMARALSRLEHAGARALDPREPAHR